MRVPGRGLSAGGRRSRGAGLTPQRPSRRGKGAFDPTALEERTDSRPSPPALVGRVAAAPEAPIPCPSPPQARDRGARLPRGGDRAAGVLARLHEGHHVARGGHNDAVLVARRYRGHELAA